MGIFKKVERYSGLYFLRICIYLFVKHIIFYPVWNLLKGLWWLTQKFFKGFGKCFRFVKGSWITKFILMNIGWFILFVLARTLVVYIMGSTSNSGVDCIYRGLATAAPLLSLLSAVTWNFWYLFKKYFFANSKKTSDDKEEACGVYSKSGRSIFLKKGYKITEV